MVNLQKRKEEVIKNIEQQGLLTEELKNDILKQNKTQRMKTYIGLLNKRKRQGQLRRNVKG